MYFFVQEVNLEKNKQKVINAVKDISQTDLSL